MTYSKLPADGIGNVVSAGTHASAPRSEAEDILASGSNLFLKPKLSALRVQVFRYKYHARFPEHSHNETSIVVCTAGLLESIQMGRREVLTPGDVIITNRNTLHSSRYGLEGGISEGVTIDLEPNVIEPILQSIRLSSFPLNLAAVIFLGRVHIPKAARVAREIVTELRFMKPGYSLKVSALAELIVVEVLRKWPCRLVGQIKSLNTDCLPRWNFIRAVETMQCSTQSSFSIGHLARELSEPSARFSRQFRASTNLLPLDFFHQLLMNRALQLLKRPHVAVKEVAYDLGFTSMSHFSSMFKTYYGESPSTFLSYHDVVDTR